MESFNTIYNDHIKSDRTNETVFKSRLKKKYNDFINGNNNDLLCKFINLFSISVENKSPEIIKQPEINKDTKKKIEEQDEKIRILNLCREQDRKKFTKLENKYTNFEYEINEKLDRLLKIDKTQKKDIAFLEHRLWKEWKDPLYVPFEPEEVEDN